MKTWQGGFTVIEVILAAAILAILGGGAVGIVIQSYAANQSGKERTIAAAYASAGLETIRLIRKNFFGLLSSDSCLTGTGLDSSSGWHLTGSGTSDGLEGGYTRTIYVCDVQRDAGGNVVESGGTVDQLSKKISVNVTWGNAPRERSISFSTYLTDWRRTRFGGFLAFARSLSEDLLFFNRLISDPDWLGASSVADFDSGSSDRSPRIVQLYSGLTRDEKILLSRHYDGVNQYVYAQVFDGADNTWGNVQLLASWAGGTAIPVRNFSGSYLGNGHFLAVYSDNTSTPKFRAWNGSSWTAENSLAALNDVPNWITVRNRDGSNEAMAVFYTAAGYTQSQYFDGSSWSGITTHATGGPDSEKDQVAFEWSLNNPLVGAIAYPDGGADSDPDTKIWTANGSGGGSFSSSQQTSGTGSPIGSVALAPRPGADEFLLCLKDADITPNIRCLELNHSNVDLTPTNPDLDTSTTATGERSFDIAYEGTSGNLALAVYSDTTGSPKYKKYDPANDAWDASASALTTAPLFPSAIQAINLVSDPNSDLIMAVLADTDQRLYSAEWDGVNDGFFPNVNGLGFTQHTSDGTADNEFWFDFTWNNF